MTIEYVLAPVAGYVTAGCLKMLWRAWRAGSWSMQPQGMGGLPSTHAATVSAPLALMLWQGRWSEPAFGVALALVWIVIVDALDLRRRIGQQAALLNSLLRQAGRPEEVRESIGHRPVEVLAGVVVGLAVAGVLAWNAST